MISRTITSATPRVLQREHGQHVREQTSVLNALERRALIWLAHHMPRWVNSDHLSLLGLASMFGAGAAFAAARWYPSSLLLVVAALILNWFGDSLDGTLARVRNQQRPRYGFYVDHVIDVAGAMFLLAGLGLSGYMNAFIALALLVAYLMVTAESFLATHSVGVFRMSAFGVGPTELRIILAIGVLRLLGHPMVAFGNAGTFRLFDIGGVVAVTALTVTFVVSAVRNTRALYRAEPLPTRQNGPSAG